MSPRLLLPLVCTLSLAAAAAPAPRRPVAAPKPTISEDQVRGWEAVGKVLIGAHAMQIARRSCGAGMAFALGPEQLGEIVAAAVGAPLAQVEDASAAPGWYDHLGEQRVARLLVGGACDADTASFVASELDGMVGLPAADLRELKDLGTVPAARWSELTGMQREHQQLAFGQFNEFTNELIVASEVAKRCPAAKARVDALMAKADASTTRFTGASTSKAIARQLTDPNAAHMNASVREQADTVLASAEGCGTERFESWLQDTEIRVATLLEKSAGTPPLPQAWREK
jgi:hypothetical protein